jgi:hypothetical protein
MTLDLTEAEERLLAELLDSDYRDLKEEIHRTETFDYKEALKEREALLIGILGRLGVPIDV